MAAIEFTREFISTIYIISVTYQYAWTLALASAWYESVNNWYLHTGFKTKIVIETFVDDIYCCQQWPLLLTWFNFNPSMDK